MPSRLQARCLALELPTNRTSRRENIVILFYFYCNFSFFTSFAYLAIQSHILSLFNFGRLNCQFLRSLIINGVSLDAYLTLSAV